MEPILIAEIWIFMSFSKIIDGNIYLSNTLIFFIRTMVLVKRVSNFPPKNKNPDSK